MKLRYLSLIIPQQEGSTPVASIACASNGMKTIVASSDRSISLLDENGQVKDKFATKPVDSKFGKKSYIVKSIAVSPDSTRIAIGQTDNVVFVYKIGASWNEKKVIINKLMQTSAVTAINWPFDDKILIGLLDGKVRVGLLKTNKCSSLYKTDQSVISISTNPKCTAFISGHIDGSVILYNFSSKSQTKVCTLQIAPYCAVLTAHGLFFAGADRRVLSYTENGVVQQQFDYSEQNEKEFSAIATDPTGQNVVVASYDRLRLFSWSSRRGAWDEGNQLEIKNVYSITALGWKGDGAHLYCGTLCGSVISIDCCLRRGMLRSRFETTYVAPSHVIVRDVTNETRTNLISNKGLSIDDIKMMGRDRFAVGITSSTLVIADTETGKSSETDWHSGGNEKFYFEFANVCLLINAGEITVVEMGIDGALGWVRTELTNPHLISVRVSERPNGSNQVKKIAYLPDPSTVAIQNLINGEQELTISHTSAIDWLELNETATKLLFRDKRSRVTLTDLISQKSSNLLSFCTYVQWVPMSDVIVAQSGDTLHVWYNSDLLEQVTMVQVKGDVEDVLRDSDRTEVIVQESNAKVAYELDNTQIEFGAALDNRDLERAITFLEHHSGGMDTYTMWRRVADLALEQHHLYVAQRCYAAINDIARVNLLHETIELANEASQRLGGDGTQDFRVRANLAKMSKKFKEAEKIYLEQNDVDSAVGMYQTLHKWDEALELAKATNYSGYDQLKTTYFRALFDTGQEAKAAELKLAEGDAGGAVQLFLKANQPVKALNVVLNDSTMSKDENLLQTIATSLLNAHIFDRAGDIFEKMKDFRQAVDCYRKGKAFAKAVQLARFAFPEEVVGVEEEWGDQLVLEAQHDAAINHYLEANKTQKAIEAAIAAKEWSKAVQIVDVIQDQDTSKKYYGKIADHYATIGEYDRAERLFIEAELHNQAIAMYVKSSRWADAYRLSEEFFGKEETVTFYERKAEELEQQNRFSEAEQLYISIGMSNKAVQMYMNAGRNDDVVRLVERYHGDHLQETHKHLAVEHEQRGDYRAAEEEFLKAGDWRAAMNMYRDKEMWSDAYRLAKSEGNDTSQKQIAFLWARSLGGEAAVRLLNKFAMLDDAIDHACENGAFDFAFDLARLGAKERLEQVHLRMAAHLEEEGKLEEAAQHFISGGKPDEAIQMYMHEEDWTSAETVARDHAPQSLPVVFVGQAKKALENEDHASAESLLLRASRPDLILRYFKERRMWPDALRIAKDYLPNELLQLQEEFERAELHAGARGVDSFIAQAKEWEAQSEWVKAVQAYLQVSPEATENSELVKQCALKAGELALKFLIGSDQQLLGEVLNRLEETRLQEKAAELLLTMGNTPEAVAALCRAQQWSKAKQVATEFLPELVPQIEAAYKESLRNEGRLGELIDVDVISAIDLLVERGQWGKALETAKQQKHQPLLDKYVAQYCGELLSQGDYDTIVKTFVKYGASANPANFNLYKALLDRVVEAKISSPQEEYELLAPTRDLFLSVVEAMKRDDTTYLEEFERFVIALNLLALRAALKSVRTPEAQRLKLKQSISLIRYTDIIPADRIFFEAGMECREYGNGYENMAFLLLNHYLDLVDAIDEGNGEMVDYSAFDGSDVPTEVPLPEKQWLPTAEHEEIKEWVLAISVDDGASKEIRLDERGVFEASLTDNSGRQWDPCCITGYPVVGTRVEAGDLAADREDLNRFLLLVKTNQTDLLLNAQDFISKWAHSSLAMAL